MYHLGSAPADFNLDDVLELASPTSARHEAWALESGWLYYQTHGGDSLEIGSFRFLAHYGNVSMLEQLLDRLALDGDGDRKPIVDVASAGVIAQGNPDNFRTLMNHQSTAKAMKTVEMLQSFSTQCWRFPRADSDNLKEWTKLITGLFDMLASDTISSPNYLLWDACKNECMPIIEKLFERGKVDSAFQEQLLQPTDGLGPLIKAALSGYVEILRYLCQQDGIEAHASNRDTNGWNILAYYCCNPGLKVEIIELLLNNFPWLVSERGGGDVALIQIIRHAGLPRPGRMSDSLESAKLLLHHTQATPGLVDVDKLLAEAVRSGWPGMCRMLLVDGHADAQTVVKRSSSGRLELKEHCLEDRLPEEYWEPDKKVLDAVTGCLSEEVLEGITAAGN